MTKPEHKLTPEEAQARESLFSLIEQAKSGKINPTESCKLGEVIGLSMLLHIHIIPEPGPKADYLQALHRLIRYDAAMEVFDHITSLMEKDFGPLSAVHESYRRFAHNGEQIVSVFKTLAEHVTNLANEVRNSTKSETQNESSGD